MEKRADFPYNPQKLDRELKRHYISASQDDINEMLKTVGSSSLDELFDYLPADIKHKSQLDLERELSYEELADHLFALSQKNGRKISFLGDGLQVYKTEEILPDICAIRGLTTAYTPYQPEKSQGTLQTLWIYQSLLAEITGFEAINASLYDRSTCLFEAINCARRLTRGTNKALVASNLYPQDIEVLKTLAQDTDTELLFAPIDPSTGRVDTEEAKRLLKETTGIAAFVFAQTTHFGTLEDVNTLTDMCSAHKVKSIAVIDPIPLSNGALKRPADYGSSEQGCDIIIGEGQHLAIGANFGGPGLGIFGIRFNEKDKRSIRSTAGRYIGKARDLSGRDCLSIILSTREQHIRREKATSNICSNQAFIASAAGACLLAKGSQGLQKSASLARENTLKAVSKLLQFQGVELAFKAPFYNEVTLKLSKNSSELIKKGSQVGLQIGVDVSGRNGMAGNLLMISFSDIQTDGDIQKLVQFFASEFEEKGGENILADIPKELKRSEDFFIPQIEKNDLLDYYQRLGKQNFSPDDGIYPLGSCTMKYNPYINDYTASFEGFTSIHPQAPIEDAQGCLELLYQIQEIFKEITGLPGVTTQPVAGAQGELVGLKMFQAYHRDRGEERNIMIIPRSAHGTNPATAAVAGYTELRIVDADETGRMNIEQIKTIIKENQNHIAGIMVTNPNTAGIFETNFKEVAELIHQDGGLVYMDGANMNAIAGYVDLDKLGVDAVHNNLHKTWTIPHGGGGPGDAIVAVSHRLVDYLPGHQVIKTAEGFTLEKPDKSIGEFHRHFGNFAHKVRAYTYLRALGPEGVKRMSAVAVLSAQYLLKKLTVHYPTLPQKTQEVPRMHEFIITLSAETFAKIEAAGLAKAQVIARIGKLFLDFGFHAPTVAFPEQFGLMIEPTESFTKKELDDFAEAVIQIKELINTNPEVLLSVPHFTPIDRVDEVAANKDIIVSEKIEKTLPTILQDRVNSGALRELALRDIKEKIVVAHNS